MKGTGNRQLDRILRRITDETGVNPFLYVAWSGGVKPERSPGVVFMEHVCVDYPAAIAYAKRLAREA